MIAHFEHLVPDHLNTLPCIGLEVCVAKREVRPTQRTRVRALVVQVLEEILEHCSCELRRREPFTRQLAIYVYSTPLHRAELFAGRDFGFGRFEGKENTIDRPVIPKALLRDDWRAERMDGSSMARGNNQESLLVEEIFRAHAVAQRDQHAVRVAASDRGVVNALDARALLAISRERSLGVEIVTARGVRRSNGSHDDAGRPVPLPCASIVTLAKVAARVGGVAHDLEVRSCHRHEGLARARVASLVVSAVTIDHRFERRQTLSTTPGFEVPRDDFFSRGMLLVEGSDDE